jgi:stage II sporulation protein D
MVSTFAAAVLAALGLAGSTPAGHAVQGTQAGQAVQPSSPAFFVAGHGWGHGVGMPQYGAYGYALHGWTYDRIVPHYYTGTTLGRAPLRKVRVLLVGGSKRILVSSRSSFFVRDGTGRKRKLAPGKQELKPGLKLNLAAAKRPRALPGPLVFSPGAAPLAVRGRTYRGTFRVTASGSRLRLVNTVGLESYLWGVVPSEMPDRWPAAALQAQAVVARTYALRHLHTGDFDLYPDTRSQVYGGISAESPTTSDAVNQTAGEIVLYKGRPANTFFYSSSGGKTADVQDVWPSAQPLPYLVSVPDPYDTLSPYHNWGPLRFPPKMLARRLHARGRVLDLRTDAGASGRVRTLTVVGAKGDRTMSGAAVRAALGLRSTWFQIGMLSLAPPARPLVFGSEAQLTGVVRGLPRVTLATRPYGGQWKPLAPLVPRGGQVSASVAPKLTTDYRLSTGKMRSGIVRLSVAPLVRILAASDKHSLSGQERPVLPGAAVQVQRLGQSGWATVSRTTTDTVGSFTARVELTPGSYRARVIAGKGFAVGVSKVLRVVAA